MFKITILLIKFAKFTHKYVIILRIDNVKFSGYTVIFT